MTTVFISYAKEDVTVAYKISENLKDAGFETWFDKDKLLPGQNWSYEIRQAIKKSDFFIALLSSYSISKRGFVQKELKQALDVIDELPDYQLFVIPIRLEPCLITNEKLLSIQWIDFFPFPEVGMDKLLKILINIEKSNGCILFATTENL